MKSKIVIGTCIFVVLVVSVALILGALSNMRVEPPDDTTVTRNDTEPAETTSAETTAKPSDTVIYIGTTEEESETAEETSSDTETDETSETTEEETTKEKQTETTAPEESEFDGVAATMFGSVSAKNAFVFVDGEGVIASKGGMNARIAPASVTKVFSILTALDYVSLSETITVGEEIGLIGKDSSVAKLSVGNKLSMLTLFEAMLIPSGNDAAYVLAAYTGRVILDDEEADTQLAVAAFIDAMNQKAKEEGMTGTHFACPDGYDTADHYTTPNDLIKIALLADDCPAILKCAGMTSDEVTLISGEKKTWNSTNSIINPLSEYYREEAYGLKTGSTDDAGYCLLTLANIEGKTVVIGVFGSPKSSKRFIDTDDLIDGTVAYLRIINSLDKAA